MRNKGSDVWRNVFFLVKTGIADWGSSEGLQCPKLSQEQK